MRRHSVCTVSVSVLYAVQSRALGASHRYGTVHRTRCRCTAGLRVPRGRDVSDGSCLRIPRHTVRIGGLQNTDVAVMHKHINN